MKIPSLLRPDLLKGSAFSVSQLPCKAKLDQNESPFEIPEEAKEVILSELAGAAWNRYPQPAQFLEVKERFAAALGLQPEMVVLTAGCDQVILAAYWAAGGAGRRARVFEPTYPMFGHYARITQTALDSVTLGPDFDVAGHGLGDPVDLMMLVSPNNPTGQRLDRGLILEALAMGGLTLVDEAYADYAGCSVLDLVDGHPNLLVGRSLSKAQLAGIRLGYAVGHPELIQTLEALLFAPYHLSALQLLTAQHFGLIQPHLAAHVAAVVQERERVSSGITALGLEPLPSQANFILFAVPDPGQTYRGLLERQIRLRDVSSMPGLDGHLRVTVGIPDENDLFLEALAAAL